ncbi:MAG TPA: hypothetical protein VHE81_15960 [Lacipirellulaceae bacterium]|nr:hypothetical protein [Lacipirellulaceae bacterium]
MFRKWILHLFVVAVAMNGAATAIGYSPYKAATAPTPYSYNPFGALQGYAGKQLRDQYTSAAHGQQMSLNEMALKNAQQITANSAQPPASMPGAGRIGLGLGTSTSGNKPFSGFSQGPTVSPYLNLFRTDLSGNTGLNYSTLVAPQLQQEQFNRQQQREDIQIARRLQAITAQPAFNPQGSREELPTGHQTVYQYFDHFYPASRPVQKKR